MILGPLRGRSSFEYPETSFFPTDSIETSTRTTAVVLNWWPARRFLHGEDYEVRRPMGVESLLDLA